MEVFFKGQAMELLGTPLEVGVEAPNVKMLNHKGDQVELHDVIKGHPTVISVVPNVLTRTCELQTKRFEELSKEKGFQYVTVSKNTVDEFNQWNQDNDLNVPTLSDAEGQFAEKYGLGVKMGEDELLTRAVIVVNKDGEIVYQEIVEEVTLEPDYDRALDALAEL